MELFELFATIALKDDKFKSGIDNALGVAKSFSDKAGGAIINAGKVMATGLAVATTAFGGLSLKALELGGELEQNMGGSEAVFKNFASTVQKTGTTAFKDMGLAQSEFLATANKMGALMQGSGLSIETSMNLSTQAMQRAADVASIMGVDTSAAMEAVTGAAKGNFTMMDNLGVAMNATTIEAYALSKGIKTGYSEMENSQKVNLAMQMFLEKTAYAAGNYAKENETLAGSFGTAKAAMVNFLSGAGDVESLVAAFTNASDVIVKNVKELLPRLTEGVKGIIQGLIPVIPTLIAELLPSLIEGGTTLIAGLVAIMPELATTIITSFTAAIETQAPILSQAIQPFIDAFTKISDAVIESGLIENIINLFSKIGEKAIEITPNIADIFSDALVSVIETVSEAIGFLADNFETVLNVLTPLTAAFVAYKVAVSIATVIQAVATAMNGLTLAQTAAEVATKLLNATMLNNPFVAVATLIAGVVTALVLLYKNNETFRNAVNKTWQEIKSAVMPIITSFSKMFGELIKAIEPLIKATMPALKSIFSVVFDAVKNTVMIAINYVKMQLEIAIAVFTGLINFIQNVFKGNWQGAFNDIKGIVENVFNAIKSFLGDFPQKMLQIGKDIVAGIGNGIREGASAVKQQVENFAKGLLDSAKSALKIKSPSQAFRDEFGLQIAEGAAIGISTGASKAEKAAAAMAKMTLDSAKTWIKDYKNSTDYLVEEEIKMWEFLSSRYKEKSKERVDMEATITKLKAEQLAEQSKNQEEADKKSYEFSASWIEAKKQLNLISLQEEIEAWERVQARYAEGTAERKSADENLYKAREALVKNQEKIVNEMQAVEDSYNKKLEERTQAIFNAFGLFEQLTEKENARDKELEEATKRHNDLLLSIDKLNQELAKTDSYEKQSEIMLKLIDEQDKLAKSSEELTRAKGEALKTEGQVLLENLEKQVQVLKKWSSEIDSLSKKGIDDGLLQYLREMGPKAYSEVSALNDMTNQELTKYSNKWKEKTELAKKEAIQQTKELRVQADSEIKGLLGDLANSMSSQSNPVGINMIQGIINGVNSKSQELRQTMQSIMNEVIAMSQQTLQIKSPSRIFKKMGEYVDEGFIDGLNSKAGDVQKSVKNTFSGFGIGEITPTLGTTSGTQKTSSNEATRPPNNITVQIINTNSINSSLDINMISKKLAEQTANALRSKGVFA